MKTASLEELMTSIGAAFVRYGFDPAAYADETLRGLMADGWSFEGVAEGLFEAMTPNGKKIGPMTPDEIYWASVGFKAGLSGLEKMPLFAQG